MGHDHLPPSRPADPRGPGHPAVPLAPAPPPPATLSDDGAVEQGTWARFDDLVAGTALAFDPPVAVVVARTPAEVGPTLREVEAHTAAGRWAAGFLAYEAAPGLDPTLPTHRPDGDLLWFGITDAPPRAVPPVATGTPPPGPWVPDWAPEEHATAVAAVRERIAAGDTYQVNLTTRLRGPAPADPLAAYASLALAQRGAWNGYLDTGTTVVASASPELFLQRTGDSVLVRPMKGTAARGRTTAEDDAARAALLASAKDRAENVMVVDLVRNDLARVAVTGGVEVTRLLAAERYPTVHQLTSDVRAILRPGTGLVDLLTALFPCGSVTGAPKASSMAVIRELETSPRGVYCGAVGFVGPGTARFSVAIRTLVVDRGAGTAVYGAGGGITWASDPAAEHAELLTKTRVLTTAPPAFALLETMRHTDDGLRNWPGHRARLLDSAVRFGFAVDVDRVERALAGLVGDLRVRLTVARDGTPTVETSSLPAPYDRPVRLALDDEPVDEHAPWPHHKTTLRAPYDTRLARHPGADDVLLVNGAGEVTESCRANLAVRLGGRWVTPPLGSGCLPGVERARLVAEGTLVEGRVTPADLPGAQIALVSSLRGWLPAVYRS